MLGRPNPDDRCGWFSTGAAIGDHAAMRVPSLLAVAVVFAAGGIAQKRSDYQADVRFAIDAIARECKGLLHAKGIDWKKVTAPLLADSKQVGTDAEHLLLLWRLLARLQDGHAEVRPLPRGKDVQIEWPDRSHGPGLFLCHIGAAVHVKNAWGPAAASGLKPGMEVLAFDGMPAAKWLTQRQAQLADRISFSTPQQADFFTCHWGLADAPGTRLAVEVRDGGSRKKRTVTFARVHQTPTGPAFAPCRLAGQKDVSWGATDAGFGYVHVRRCKADLPEQVDEALAALGAVPGLILDFRGNSGGAFDHEALFGRFLPAGTEWRVGGGYQSAGPHPYGGPMVVIVDATVRSAAETGAGQFLEDGRAYGIGESATAGMSSSKTTIDLPSQLFQLYVSVASNKARFQGGKGIEGVGVIPHELVAFDPADLAAERDTLIRRAEALLQDFPHGKVRYDPAQHGWRAPGK